MFSRPIYRRLALRRIIEIAFVGNCPHWNDITFSCSHPMVSKLCENNKFCEPPEHCPLRVAPTSNSGAGEHISQQLNVAIARIKEGLSIVEQQATV
jgi:hypothetical protein